MGQKVSPVGLRVGVTVIGIQDGTQMIKISLVYYMKILKFVIIFLKNLKQLQ